MPDLIRIERAAGDVAFFDLQATLDGVTYTLEFRWNDRLSAWFMNVLDAEGEEARLVGLRLVADYFFPRHIVDRSPPGLFLVLDTGAAAGFGEDPGFDDLGSRAQLWYIPESEL